MGFDLLRMSFTTVTANSSPMSVLPNWVEVLGKKLDKISAELDWYAHCSSSCMQTHNNTTMVFLMGVSSGASWTSWISCKPKVHSLKLQRSINKHTWEFWIMHIFFYPLNQPFALRLVPQMESVFSKMQSEYDSLTNLLSEATVNPENMDKFLGCNSEIVAWPIWPLKTIRAPAVCSRPGTRKRRSRSISWYAPNWMFRWIPSCCDPSNLT